MNNKASLLINQLIVAPVGLALEIGTIRRCDEVATDGFSTVYLAEQCLRSGRGFISFDISPEHVALANGVLADRGLPAAAKVLSSPAALRSLDEVCFLYLDASDCPFDTLRLLLQTPLAKDAVVVVDDCHTVGCNEFGKGTLVAKYLQSIGHEFQLLETEPGYRAMVFRGFNNSLHRLQLNPDESVHRALFDAAAMNVVTLPYPAHSGRGIVICAGGTRYFSNAWVTASVLRMLGCTLPIQFWHLGDHEMTDEMSALARTLGVETVDALQTVASQRVRILNGWELKPFSIIHAPFEQVLFLDADNVPAVSPEFLFDTPEFHRTGAIFWPDFGRLGPDRSIWRICGINFSDEPEFESGQLVVDKRKCWAALHLTMHLNEFSDFFYKHIHGDKDTFHMAWRKLGQEFSMPTTPITHLDGCTMVQHDFEGKPLFQHRNLRKWTLDGLNLPVAGFVHEQDCLRFLDDLRNRWSEYRQAASERAAEAGRALVLGKYLYIRVGSDYRKMAFSEDGSIADGRAGMESRWRLSESECGKLVLHIGNNNETICSLTEDGDGLWRGRWRRFEKMPVVLARV